MRTAHEKVFLQPPPCLRTPITPNNFRLLCDGSITFGSTSLKFFNKQQLHKVISVKMYVFVMMFQPRKRKETHTRSQKDRKIYQTSAVDVNLHSDIDYYHAAHFVMLQENKSSDHEYQNSPTFYTL